MRTIRFILPLAAALALGCGKSGDADPAAGDTLGRDLSLAPVDTSATLSDAPVEQPAAATPAPAPPPPAPRPTPPPPRPAPTPAPAPAPAPPPAAPARLVLASGTSLALTAIDSFSTKTHKVGQTVTARVASDVTDDRGNTVIPAGATVTLAITQLVVSENKSDSGKIELRATSVSFGGESHAIDGRSTRVAYELKGRGVQAGDAAKVGAGAAVGAVIGRVLSGKTKGAVIGGVIGAAAGTAAAANSVDRDIVVASGARIEVRLQSDFEG